MAKKKQEGETQLGNSALDKKLEAAGLADALKFADDYSDIEITTFKTGYASLDEALSPVYKGMPRGRHVAIYSKKEESGKTSLTLGIAATAQQQGLSVAIVDIEKTITKAFCIQQGLIMDPGQGVEPARIMRSSIDSADTSLDLYLEHVLDVIKKASRIFDVIIVDSIDAMVRESEAEKSTEDNKQSGGISKKLSEFFRENTNIVSTVLWINQMRQSIGAYNPTGGITYVLSGGRALPFYASIMLELAMMEKLTEGDNPPYGFRTRVTVTKNKIGPQWRTADLYYIFGEGFSKDYDYFRLAITKGFIVKKGGWFSVMQDESDEPALKQQGELKTYQALKEKPELFQWLKDQINAI